MMRPLNFACKILYRTIAMTGSDKCLFLLGRNPSLQIYRRRTVK
jgi:hypothetical protein